MSKNRLKVLGAVWFDREHLSEDRKVAWAVGKYGWHTVRSVGAHVGSLPGSLTDAQRLDFLQVLRQERPPHKFQAVLPNHQCSSEHHQREEEFQSSPMHLMYLCPKEPVPPESRDFFFFFFFFFDNFMQSKGYTNSHS